MHSFYVGVNAIADGCHRGAESDQQDVRGSLRSRCLKCSKFLKRSGVQGVTHCIVRNVRIDSVMPVGPQDLASDTSLTGIQTLVLHSATRFSDTSLTSPIMPRVGIETYGRSHSVPYRTLAPRTRFVRRG